MYLGWGIFYFTGYIVHKYDIDSLEREKKHIVCIVSSNLIGIGILKYINSGLDFGVKMLIGMSVFLLLMLNVRGLWKGSIIKLCGKYSMVVYMMHGLCQYICFLVISEYFNIKMPLLLLVSMVMFQIALALSVVFAFKKVRWFHWVEAIFYPYKYFK